MCIPSPGTYLDVFNDTNLSSDVFNVKEYSILFWVLFRLGKKMKLSPVTTSPGPGCSFKPPKVMVGPPVHLHFSSPHLTARKHLLRFRFPRRSTRSARLVHGGRRARERGHVQRGLHHAAVLRAGHGRRKRSRAKLVVDEAKLMERLGGTSSQDRAAELWRKGKSGCRLLRHVACSPRGP